MATTEGGPAVRLHPLDPAARDGLLALSDAAGWNQDADDWTHMLSAGLGWGLSHADGTLVASTVVLPYAPVDGSAGGFAWISMVLVLPDCRGRGHAARLLREALGWLAARRLVPVLDATPAGHPVYRRQGFVDTWGLARFVREAGAPAPPPAALPDGLRVEPLREVHRPALRALDAPAFGGDRAALLGALARRAPRLAHVALRDGTLAGYVLGRPGRGATQIGPLVAADPATGVALLDAALAAVPGRVLADAPDRQGAVQTALRARGFAVQRPFTRMLVPADASARPPRAPGEPSTLRLIAGPELG